MNQYKVRLYDSMEQRSDEYIIEAFTFEDAVAQANFGAEGAYRIINGKRESVRRVMHVEPYKELPEPAKNFNQEWDACFEAYWKPLLQTDGQWDETKIKNEMHDLVFVAEQTDEVYLHITGGQLSKPMYYAESIITAHDNEVARAVEAAVGDCKECKDLITAQE